MSCIPPWVPQINHCMDNVQGPRTFTFCTVSSEGMPRARTCVFRSWLFDDKKTGVLSFTTDIRMMKVEDLDRNDGRFEACFYFPNDSCQFRLSGFAQFLTKDKQPSMMSSNIPPARPIASPSSSPSSVSSSSSTFYPVYTPSYDENKHYDTEYPPPSKEEWEQEYDRMWTNTPPHIKSSMRKPPPRSLLTPDSRKQLDSIDRGVDGSSDESGKDNFVVVLMFVNSVDYYSDDQAAGGKRLLFTRMNNDDWLEQEICP